MKVSDFEKAYELLKKYTGTNNQILYLQYKIKKTNYSLSDFDVTYVIKEKIIIKRIIGEMGESYHCYAQYRKSVAPSLMYIKKRYILNHIEKPTSSINLNIEYEKYDKLSEKHNIKLKELQKESIEFLLKNKKCILANGMGTGKTITTVVAAMESGAKKILIICPASLKSTWKREICHYNDETDVTIINGSKWETNTRFTIVNYDILDNFYKIPTELVFEEKKLEDGTITRVPKIIKGANGKKVQKTRKSLKKDTIKKCLEESPMFLEKFDCVVLDEAHKLSNNTSIRYRTIEDFLKRSNIPYVFLLTGTPLTNKPMNLYHILKLIDADITRDYQYYVKRYCDGKTLKLKTGKEIMLSNGATNLDELKEKIKHVYIRILLTEMTDMVNKEIETRYYDLTPSQMNRYNELWEEYLKAQEEQGNDNSEDYRQLVEGILVRQYLAKEMTSNTIQLVDEKLEDGEKVIIVCTFSEEIDILKKYYGDKCVVYDGKMTSKQKDKAEYEFMNNPKIKVFIGQIIACSVGLTLTAAHTLIFNSYSFSSAENKQAEDRIYRLNQKNDVLCIYQLFNDSISQRMFDLVTRKQIISNNVIKSENDKISS